MTTVAEGAPVIIGAGLAGLAAALAAAPRPVTVLAAAPLGENAASAWAQGGLAAAIAPDDSIDFHIADTLAAGDGLCDAAAVRRIVGAGPALVDWLLSLGVRFDRAADGTLSRGLEAGHGRRRILHAAGDGSGREILRAVIAAVRRTPSITVIESATALRLALRDGAVAGVLARLADGTHHTFRTRAAVVATGGLGGLFLHTTNPPGAIGSGLVLAARAGAALADLEFVQFHPTALDVPDADPLPLVSEAVRGEGAVLTDETGRRFMAGRGRAELEPRDVVSRAVAGEIAAGHRVFLDARAAVGARFAARFPAIAAACAASGIDPARDPIPIRPAVHYAMGGIAVDAEGRSTVPGLYACGEAASTGLHGANRLASNSLLEAAVCGRRVGESLAHCETGPLLPAPVEIPPPSDARCVRPILSHAAGVLRGGPTLAAAAARLLALETARGPAADPAALALLMVAAMHGRRESRGAHARTDFPAPNPISTRSTLTLDAARRLAAGLEPPARRAALG